MQAVSVIAIAKCDTQRSSKMTLALLDMVALTVYQQQGLRHRLEEVSKKSHAGSLFQAVQRWAAISLLGFQQRQLLPGSR